MNELTEINTMSSSQLAEILDYKKEDINKKVRLMFADKIATEIISVALDNQNRVKEYHLPELESKMFVAKHNIKDKGFMFQELKIVALKFQDVILTGLNAGKTEKGLEFGKNITSDKNPRESSPHYYDSMINELFVSLRSTVINEWFS